MRRYGLRDDQWERIKNLLPGREGTVGVTAADGDADLQPIWLTVAEEAPNGAHFLFLVEGAESAAWMSFDRVFDLFDGRDEASVAAARRRWQAVRATGVAPVYWKQTEQGWTKQG